MANKYSPANYKEQGGSRTVIGGSLDVISGGDVDIESGASFKIAGTAVSASGTELNQYALTARVDDISTANSTWVVAPHAGAIAAIYSVIDGAFSTADAVITFEIATVAVTGGTITITQSGSAAGDVDSCTPSAANVVTAGQAIEIVNAGASTDAVPAWITFLITR